METCYRHPSRETGVACSSCGRPICPDCMTPTPVGMRCPECSKQTTRVRHARAAYDARPVVTIGLIAVNVLIWFGTASATQSEIVAKGILWGPAVADGDIWRLVTSGFLHQPDFGQGVLHIGFNMYILWFLGRMLEPAIGGLRFAALYLVSLLGGSLGALLLSFDATTVGASGAVFGLMGGAVVILRARGIDPMTTGIPLLIGLNLLLSLRPGISIGGHIGGLVAGVVAAWVLLELGEDRRRVPLALLACLALAGAEVAGAIAIS